MVRRSWSRRTVTALCSSALIAASVAAGHRAVAEPPTPDDPIDQQRRCAIRLAIALTGGSPSAEFLAAPKPQDVVDALVKDPAKNKPFIERFSRFINAQFNRAPGDALDASYYLADHVLTSGRPWSDLFQGPYDVVADESTEVVSVTNDPNGLGYFRSQLWMKAYAGNEPEGLRIRSAYRIMNNMIGVHLTAVTIAEGMDITAKSRATNPACMGCHVNGPFALDKIAGLLSKRVGFGDEMTFAAPSGAPADVLNQPAVADDESIVTALLASVDYQFHACRLAFNFLYGRDEGACEGALFDKCVDAFGADGKMQSALLAIAKDPSYCL